MTTNFIIQQFQDKALSHYAYAIVSNNEMVIIDPSRNPEPYYHFAKQQHAIIVGVIETHPHADFVSSHLEIHNTLHVPIYSSKLTGASYPHTAFDDGQKIQVGTIFLAALNTPGHSPDSICIVLQSEGKNEAVFTGDTLFIGDCGRPDLRENTGSITATRASLARDMYYSLRTKLLPLGDSVEVYPAHGAGTLCGKALSDANRSTIGAERLSNWSLQEMTEEVFITELIAEQPFIPKYFGYNVNLNRQGANNYATSISAVTHTKFMNQILDDELDKNVIAIDTKPQQLYKQSHLLNSFNIMLDGKFETWVGSIIAPNEYFYLTAQTEAQLTESIERLAKIGYETQIKAAFVNTQHSYTSDILNLEYFKHNKDAFTIIDIRNASEVKEKQIFANSINMPLAQLRENIHNIPTEKPILVHCAGGYRSAVGSSIIKSVLPNQTVYDLGNAVTTF